MPDSVLLCVIKQADIGIHLGTIGLSREEKEEREKREPGIEKKPGRAEQGREGRRNRGKQALKNYDLA